MNLIDFSEHKNKRELQTGKRNGWGLGQLFVDLVYDPLDRFLDRVAPTVTSLTYSPVRATSADVVPFGALPVNTKFGAPQ